MASIDGLYRGFESFASWERLDAATCDRWDRYAAELRRSRQAADLATLARAVSVAVRAAAVDTGALEGLYQADRGFTLSVALQNFAWEDALEERGSGVRELFEAQLAGYELAIDAVTRRTPLSEAWLRVLHERICGAQTTYRVRTEVGWQAQPLPAGRYKDLPNHVRKLDGTYHAYAPVAAVAAEMHRLVDELRSPAFDAAHPVEQAAYAHYALTVVHPFADGNGRLARALASVYLYRALSIPLTLFVNHRAAYLEASPGPTPGIEPPGCASSPSAAWTPCSSS